MQLFDTLPIVLITLLVSASICGSAYLIVFRMGLFTRLEQRPLVAPFFSAATTVFMLYMAFMASDAWKSHELAQRSLINERTAIARIAEIPILPVEAREEMLSLVSQYLTDVIELEWKGSANMAEAPSAQKTLQRIESHAWDTYQACAHAKNRDLPCLDGVMTTALIRAVDDLRAARRTRLFLGHDGRDTTKWVLVLMLAWVASMSIAAVHRDRSSSAAIGLTLFGAAMWIGFAMVGLHHIPYAGPDAIAPDLLIEVLKDLPELARARAQ